MIGMKLDVELISTLPPVGALGEQPVGDLAQPAVRPAQSSPDPVAHFTEQGAVGVVDTNEFAHGIRHGRRVPGTTMTPRGQAPHMRALEVGRFRPGTMRAAENPIEEESAVLGWWVWLVAALLHTKP